MTESRATSPQVKAQVASGPGIPATGQAVCHPGCSFGMHLEGIAAYYRIAPADAALAVASFLSNIAGPLAGFVDPNGRRFGTGISVARLDAGKVAARSLESALMHPLQVYAGYLRNRSHLINRALAEREVFGAHKPVKGEADLIRHMFPWVDEADSRHQREQQALFRNHELPPDIIDERGMSNKICMSIGEDKAWVRTSPGPTYLPSFFVERIELGNLKQVLNECMHREVLVRDPQGGVFGQIQSTASRMKESGSELADLLEGADMAFKPLHPMQGPGTLERARVHIWACTTVSQIGAVLAEEESGWNKVIKSCLVWKPASQDTPSQQGYSAAKAMRVYRDTITKLLESRMFAPFHEQWRNALPQGSEGEYESLRRSYANLLDRVDERDAEYVANHGDLPERLLWAFMLLREEKETYWCLQAAFRTAVYALRTKQHVLSEARRRNQEEAAMRALDIVCTILHRKGPCSLREMQRSSNNLRAAFLRPGVELLERQGRLRVLPGHRYELLPNAGQTTVQEDYRSESS